MTVVLRILFYISLAGTVTSTIYTLMVLVGAMRFGRRKRLAPFVPQKWLTGIGIITAMQVTPSTTNFKGAQITESLSTVSNSCPSSFGNQCVGSSTFTVGAGDTMWDGTSEPARTNIFYDQHYTTNSQNILALVGISSCTAVCKQTYSCAGKPIGSFTVTKDYEPGTINGYAVTNVNASKH